MNIECFVVVIKFELAVKSSLLKIEDEQRPSFDRYMSTSLRPPLSTRLEGSRQSLIKNQWIDAGMHVPYRVKFSQVLGAQCDPQKFRLGSV